MNDTAIDTLLTAYKAPQSNGICERLWGNLRWECLDFYIPLGERHLKWRGQGVCRLLQRRQPHQSIEQKIPYKLDPAPAGEKMIPAFPILGGLQHDY